MIKKIHHSLYIYGILPICLTYYILYYYVMDERYDIDIIVIKSNTVC